jgi:hypothetical protein
MKEPQPQSPCRPRPFWRPPSIIGLSRAMEKLVWYAAAQMNGKSKSHGRPSSGLGLSLATAWHRGLGKRGRSGEQKYSPAITPYWEAVSQGQFVLLDRT